MQRLVKLPERHATVDLVVLLAAVILTFGLKASTLNTPFYWDEAGTFMAPSRALAQGSLLETLPGRHAPGTLFGHPPLIYLVYALGFRLCGDSLAVAHLIELTFAVVAVWFTYRIGARVCNPSTGAAVGCLPDHLYRLTELRCDRF